MTGDVDFTPFLDSGTDSDLGTAGFQGDFHTLHVSDLGSQTGVTGRIQEGVNLVAGSTVLVGPGTFNESPVVTTSNLDLRGAQYGVAVGGRTFADASESTINGQLGLQAADISVDGFSIKNHVSINSSAIGILVKTAGSGASITNNILGAILSDYTSGNQAHAEGIYLENGPDDVTISDNLLDGIHGWATSQAIYVGDSSASSASTGVQITDNTIQNVTSDAGGAYGIMTNNATGAELTITGNTLDTLTGGWVHAVSFEGPTSVADVEHNTVTNLVSGSADRIAVFFENDAPFVSALVSRNGLDVGSDRYGVVNASPSGTLDATCNWWGDASGPSSVALGGVGPGTGSTVVAGSDFAPWLISSDLSSDCETISVAVDTAAADANGNEGDTLSTSGTFSGDVASITADNGGLGTFTDHGDGTWSWDYTPDDDFATTTITVTAHGTNGSTADDSFDTSAVNVAPTAVFNAPTSQLYSTGFNISLSSPSDPSSADTTAGFTYDFDCGSGYSGSPTGTASASCTAPASPGNITVKGKIFDQDGDSHEYTQSVEITQPQISLTPASHDFGTIVANSSTSPFTFTVKNTGTADLTIQGVGLAGTNPAYFGIDTNNCDLAVLAPNATCTIAVFYHLPASPSTNSPSARLEVDSDDPNTPTAMSNLSGHVGVPSQGTITINLDARPDGSQSFAFHGDLGSFNLVDDGSPSNTHSFANQPAGTYVVQLASVSKWALIGLTCDTPETIQTSKRKVTIHLGEGENVSCTYTESVRVPDELIALSSSGTYSGDNVYSSTVIAGQTLSQAIARGDTKSFFVHAENDGLDTDTYKLYTKLTGSTRFHVWIYVGNVDVTAQVNANTYKLTLAPGQQKTIEIRVKAKPRAKAHDYKYIDLYLKSKSATAAKDVVRASVTRA